ncbi:MAG: ribonuclease HII [Candidatus Zambryskibacteria bacterium CG10_big_fil_rev_8_21_14_0_10_34_34]|uniref:Ribonuclease n=1 Tax=Candidatus Zambryskibacteria bacterium CG10_big_fil_rev_8_21_14_0_10_34_34 TaxID=1975114 RepID=A0A2H0R341_9BACT|nr:MAG: ribonuclease HII [Candidatus Zambryskibacteria bacterium CG10_big_fil_rev_8_21_14_0_10_34_34]
MSFIVGIDEAGRGPLAGPVSVGIFMTDQKTGNWILKNIFENKLRDSKKLSPKKREEIYKKFLILRKNPTSLKLRGASKIFFSVISISNKIIDEYGISKAIQTGVTKSLKKLHHTSLMKKGNPSFIRLDGLLKAPKEFKNQKTIIKGDEKDVFIACASIVAKVSRDRLMRRLAKKYPKYHFEIHKGYGTILHRNLIKKYGLSPLHRKTFCKI